MNSEGWGPSAPLVVSVVGPTASGKSAVGLRLAQRLGAEIVNADAYAVYRGMDIGTAKPTTAQLAAVRHHLVDALEISEPLSVAWYQAEGRRVLADLARRAVPAVVVGGSGLYVKALLDDLRFPGSDPVVRARWEQQLAESGAPALHVLLQERDPVAAAAILPSNGRRIVRALEVVEMTGQPFVATMDKAGPPFVAHHSFGLELSTAVLDERIAGRVSDMLGAGWLQEVSGLRTRGLAASPTARMALGYQSLLDHLAGELSLADAQEQIVTATRRYARRQRKWFRADPRTHWLCGESDVSSTVEAILSLLPPLGP